MRVGAIYGCKARQELSRVVERNKGTGDVFL